MGWLWTVGWGCGANLAGVFARFITPRGRGFGAGRGIGAGHGGRAAHGWAQAEGGALIVSYPGPCSFLERCHGVRCVHEI
jgi:hypothetical protein